MRSLRYWSTGNVEESCKKTRPAIAGGERTAEQKTAGMEFPEGKRYQRLSDPISGGMGIVFKALDLNLDIEVAIKRIRPEFARNEELIRRFEREAKVQVRLRHPNLVQVRDYLKDSFGPYLVMDWIEGESLAAAIQTHRPMNWSEASVLISKVAMALQVAHDAGIIHRDIKPANILLDKKGEPFITDFGLARVDVGADGASETNKDAMLGTIHFMSPEQIRNPKGVTHLSDVWSLGATLHQVVTGVDVLAMRESRIPEAIREIVLKAIEREPEERFGTMKQFAADLMRAVEEGRSKSMLPKTDSAVAQEDLAEIWRQTQEQTEKAHAKAKATAEESHDYAAAVQMMEAIPERLRQAKFYEELVQRRDQVQRLEKTIRACVHQLQTDGLQEAIMELLTLQPNRADMKKLLSQLSAQTQRDAHPAPSKPDSNKSQGSSPARLVAPFDVKQARAAQDAWAKHLGIGVEVTNSLGVKFRVIPPGTFDMGSPASEPNRYGEESLHKVTITQPKLMGMYPVTQGEWTKLIGSNPSHFKSVSGQDTSRFPVESVSWEDCQVFLKRLNESHGMKGWRYRLPTEAEWEYACRAGTVTPFWFGGELNGKQANCDGNYPYQASKGPYLERPSVVGSYGANAFGLYDQPGQVWEWCQDTYGQYETGPAKDPTGPSSGSSRVLRGGSWRSNAYRCRSAFRYGNAPSLRHGDIGFRVLCELS
ncbi:MAG: SUMF1/EgtB/PvdO family nonheme iron enzyme [Planctomycetaceae bacterium]|nr:SUMF1/EgtB/PvdO family nonheme iron enzyme [Planctomycetaceae bacterium]